MLTRTITQNSALYLAQHRILPERSSIFGRKRAAAKDWLPDLRRPAFSEAYFIPRFFQAERRLGG